MQFYKNFVAACNKKNIAPSTLLIKLGKSKGLITQWKNGSMPSIEIIPDLANSLDTTADYLILNKESSSDLSNDERELIKNFRKLSYKEQIKLIGKLENMIETRSFITIKCSEYKVSAGMGEELGNMDSWNNIEIPDSPNAEKADFALVISGDSMLPLYNDNDIILVQQTDAVDVGEIAVFIVNGAGYIKKFGGDRLISLNDNYNDILFENYDFESVHCVGRVLGRA